jgi:curved DNA-binding protein CbpA
MQNDPFLHDLRKPFDILGLKITATEAEIDKRRRRLLLQVHPDKIRGNEAERTANEAKTKVYNDAHEKAKALARDPWFQSIIGIVRETDQNAESQNERRQEEIRKHQDEIREETRKHQEEIQKTREETAKISEETAKLKKAMERQHFFSRMIDIISNERGKLRSHYDESEFKKNTQKWTAEQYRDANDAVQYGLSDSREMLNKTRCQLEEAKQDIARLREQIGLRDTAAPEVQPPSQEQLHDIRTQHQKESEQAQMLLEGKLKDMEIQLTRRAEIAEAKAKEWEHKYTALQISIENEAAEQTDSERGIKKRKHTKFLENERDSLAFQNNLAAFISTQIQAKKSGFLSTNAIKEAFMKYTGQSASSQFFYKNLKKGIENNFSTVTQGSSNGERGYHGVAFFE